MKIRSYPFSVSSIFEYLTFVVLSTFFILSSVESNENYPIQRQLII